MIFRNAYILLYLIKQEAKARPYTQPFPFRVYIDCPLNEKYCINCGEEEDFLYIRSTASPRLDTTTNHYECRNCGEEFSWEEKKDD